jgi:polyisoprenoid-binding protein YceI
MKHMRIGPMTSVALALAFAATTAVWAQNVPSLPLRQGDVSFAVTVDNGPDFIGHVEVASAAFTGATLADVRGFAEVRVAAMRTGTGLRDRHLRNAMDADSFPTIRFDLDAVRIELTHGDTTDVELHGFLLLHGQRRALRAEGVVVMRDSGVAVVASFPVDMREYGIMPPVRFLGSVRVRSGTHVTATLRFGGSPASGQLRGT